MKTSQSQTQASQSSIHEQTQVLQLILKHHSHKRHNVTFNQLITVTLMLVFVTVTSVTHSLFYKLILGFMSMVVKL